MRCDRGREPLLRLLRTRLHDLRDETPDTFPRWLERHLRAWAVDPTFQQRVRIRELRRTHPELQALERERQGARAAYEASPLHGDLEKLRRELAGAENAVAGLEHALGRATELTEQARLREKLHSYTALVAELGDRFASLRAESAEWMALHDVGERLRGARATSGFDREVARLEEMQRSQGRSSGRSGSAFEDAAAEVVRSELLPELAVDGRAGDGEIVLLRGVRLGSARAEFDHLVVRAAGPDSASPVEVIAAVEAKRNLNDIGHGLRQRLENLAWFAGRAGGYRPELYRTSRSPTGHFEESAVHAQDGRDFVFSRESFGLFDGRTGEEGDLPSGLYLVTRPGTLWGIGSAALARLAHRVSSDPAFSLEDPSYVRALLDWSRTLAHAVEAPDVLRRFAVDEESARRILLIGPVDPAPA